jgi:hypothetical protein
MGRDTGESYPLRAKLPIASFEDRARIDPTRLAAGMLRTALPATPPSCIYNDAEEAVRSLFSSRSLERIRTELAGACVCMPVFSGNRSLERSHIP